MNFWVSTQLLIELLGHSFGHNSSWDQTLWPEGWKVLIGQACTESL